MQSAVLVVSRKQVRSSNVSQPASQRALPQHSQQHRASRESSQLTNHMSRWCMEMVRYNVYNVVKSSGTCIVKLDRNIVRSHIDCSYSYI
jgi:hypothetical protein